MVIAKAGNYTHNLCVLLIVASMKAVLAKLFHRPFSPTEKRISQKLALPSFQTWQKSSKRGEALQRKGTPHDSWTTTDNAGRRNNIWALHQVAPSSGRLNYFWHDLQRTFRVLLGTDLVILINSILLSAVSFTPIFQGKKTHYTLLYTYEPWGKYYLVTRSSRNSSFSSSI